MTVEECRRFLGVDRRATPEEIRRAKQRLLLLYHPDHNPHRPEWADRQTRRVLEACEILLNYLVEVPDHTRSSRARSSDTTAPNRRPGSSAAQNCGPSRVEPKIEHRDLHYVLVRAGGQLLAIPLTSVVRVMPLRASDPRPGGKSLGHGWAGHVLVDERAIPLVDLTVALGLGTGGLEHCRQYLLTRTRRGEVALAISRVEQPVVTVKATAIEPATLVTNTTRCVKGFFRIEDDFAVVADLEALVG